MDEIRRKYPAMARKADNGHRHQAIRLKCLECTAGSAAAIKRCESHGCPLWPYRMGRGIEPRAARAEEERHG